MTPSGVMLAMRVDGKNNDGFPRATISCARSCAKLNVEKRLGSLFSFGHGPVEQVNGRERGLQKIARCVSFLPDATMRQCPRGTTKSAGVNTDEDGTDSGTATRRRYRWQRGSGALSHKAHREPEERLQ